MCDTVKKVDEQQDVTGGGGGAKSPSRVSLEAAGCFIREHG